MTAALNTLTGNNADLVNFLIANQDEIEGAFEIGTIQRVTKSERKKLTSALEHAKSLNDPKLAFLVDNSEAIADSFRWPKTARMDDAAKSAAILEALTTLANGNAQVAGWIVANKDALFEGFNAGVQKRTVNPAAANALAEYRAKKAAEKAAGEAGNAAGAQAPAAEAASAEAAPAEATA